MDIFSKLNDKQTLAVQNTEGYVRVIAGAGSGKTKLLVSRYAYLVKEYGIDSSNILCVTFTNKAAGEMKKRISNLIGPEYSTSLICTYHGFCARMIREDPEKLFLTKGFQIIDTCQQKSILEEIYAKYELKLDHACFQRFLKGIAMFKKNLDYVPKMCNPEKVQILVEIKNINDQILEEYLQRQKAIYSLDFSDLLSYALYLLKNDEEVRSKWQSRLNYIMVDEFQDSSNTEMELIDILSAQYKNLMIVGDPDQNIYEWRGSDVKLLVDFDKTHPSTKTIILNQNYRSTPQILKCANTLIEKNELRLKKDLFTESNEGAIVTHIHSKSEEDEVEWIAKTIKETRKSHRKSYSDFAILYRSSFLSRLVERKLVEENIPYEIYGGVKFYQRMEVQDVVAYLRLIAFNDDLSFKRIINKPRRQFGRVRLAALEAMRDNNDINLFDQDKLSEKSLYEVLKTHLLDPAFKGSGAAEFISSMEKLKNMKDFVKISELVNRVCNDSGYEKYIRKLGDEERLDNLSEFKRIANEFENGFGEDINLEEFLQQIALMSAEDTDKPCEAVKLMTIHASKGLEFPVVFTIGFSEGIFPNSKSIEERKKLGLEEERRLCYVAITRSREILYIMDSEGLGQQGIKKLPSRFLYEIGETNYQRIGKISSELEKESFEYIQRLNLQMLDELPAPENSELQTIEHHIFGTGKVLSFDSKRKVYSVQFEGMNQPRSISAEYFTRKHDSLPKIQNSLALEALEMDILQKNELKITVPEIIEEDEEIEYRDLPHYEDDVETEEYEFQTQEKVIVPENTDEIEETEIEITEEPEEPNSEVEVQSPDLDNISDELREQLKNAVNHLDDPEFPMTGWICSGITDLGKPSEICRLCGHQIIRYVHHMHNTQTGMTLGCGCICAGKLEGDLEKAREREGALKNKLQRKISFKKKKWKKSAKGHEYLKVKNHLMVIFHFKNSGKWTFSLDNNFSEKKFNSREECLEGIFNALDELLYS
ncbi:ATP-dependent helicase [Treponema sp.]|uniref:ATP-dependent helicase n=1 Tax=Treponema sp. TaxID=166 RepID=UPI00298E483F|nr:UvrD-helicase domain-containing protein [Treponema sp.]MCQ2240034.1 UvrD-helicase domain-containing protein [Treponema sp.]